MRMKLPIWLLRLLPMWSYICPRCRREVKRNSHKCPYCGEKYGKPLKVPPLFLKNKEALERYVHERIFPRISAKQREYLAKFFTEIFSDGFESGDFSAWTGTGGGGEVQSNVAYEGTYAAHYTGYGYAYKDFTDQNILHGRFYIRYGTLPDGSKRISLMRQGSTNLAELYYEYTGSVYQFRLRRYLTPSTDLGTYEITLNTGQWYCVEWSFDNVNDKAKVWLDGSLIIDGSTDWGTYQVSRFFIITDSYTGTNVYFDSVVVADTYIGTSGGETEITVTDAISLSDSVLRHKTLSVTDSINASDSILGHKTLTLSDIIQAVEQILRNKNFSISDSISLADAVTVITEILKTVLDSIQLSDSALAHKTLSIQDAVQTADAILRDKSFAVSDSISLSDVANVITEIIKTVLDNISLSDAVLSHKELAILDSISLLEQILRHKSFLIQDSITLTENVLRNKIIEVQDQINLLENIVSGKLFIIADQIGLADTVQIIQIVKVVHDSLKLIEQILTHKELIVKDQIQLLDIITLIGLITKILKLILTEFLPVKIVTQEFKPVTISTEEVVE